MAQRRAVVYGTIRILIRGHSHSEGIEGEGDQPAK
jgi:hypothetical protein